MFLSIIIPAYNEEKRIGKTLGSVDAYMKAEPYRYEIIVVDDGSKDETLKTVEMCRHHISNLTCISYPENHGKGYAIRKGMLAARGSVRLFMDADGSTSIDHLSRLLHYANRGYQVVISSRHAPGSWIKVPQGRVRIFLGTLFRFFTHILVPLRIRDTQNGFKMFTAHAAEEIFSRQTIDRWAFDVELLAIARRLNFRIREVPIRWENDERSQMNFKGMVGMAFEILKVRRNLWLGRYDTLPSHKPYKTVHAVHI